MNQIKPLKDFQLFFEDAIIQEMHVKINELVDEVNRLKKINKRLVEAQKRASKRSKGPNEG